MREKISKEVNIFNKEHWTTPTLAVCSTKRRVGKTITSVNLAAALSNEGYKVLLIDLDGQGSSTIAYLYDFPEKTLSDVLLGNTPIEEVVTPIKENLDILPSDIDLNNLIVTKRKEEGLPGGDFLLYTALAKSNLVDKYDICVIDCPSNDEILSTNGLFLATDVIIPIKSDYFSPKIVNPTLDLIGRVQNSINPQIRILGSVCTLFDQKANVCQSSYDMAKEFFKDAMFDTKIRINDKLIEAPIFRKDIFDYAPDSTGAKDYASLYNEVLERLKKSKKEI